MKLVLLLALVAYVAAGPNEYSKYDNFNTKEIIDNIRLLEAYSHCLQGVGKCTPEGKDIKKWIPEAVQSNCGKCTEKQKSIVAELIKALMEKLPAEWEKLNAMHNSDGKNDATLKEFLAKYAK